MGCSLQDERLATGPRALCYSSVMKRVLITGCSSGFGHDLVPKLLEEGYEVWASLREAQKRSLLFEALKLRFTHQLKVYELDVTQDSHLHPLYVDLEKAGGLDVLINNAGYGLFGPLEDLTEQELRSQMEVNFFGLVSVTRAFLPLLRKSQGRIINLSSGMGYLGLPLSSMYAASKFAVEGLSESLYYELKPLGVQICLVEPGQFRTSFGKKLVWGSQIFDPFSPYFQFSKRFKEWRDKRQTQHRGVRPDVVIDSIAELLKKPSMPLRYRVGKDAIAGFWLKRLLPARVFHALMYATFRGAWLKKA